MGTKESFKCPNSKECGKYVCKPTLRGRQANYDKRTAVLDYLPRLNLALVNGSVLRVGDECALRVCVQNRHLQSAQFRFLCAVNGDDLKGKEAGVVLKVTPKFYSSGPRNVKFSVQCVFRTKLQLKDDKESKVGASAGAGGVEEKKKKEKGKVEKGNLIDAELPYILDFELGVPKAPDDGAMSIAESEEKKEEAQ